MRGRLKRAMAAGTVLAVAVSGCSSPSHPPMTSITVFATSAMIKSLSAIGKQFEAENPGTAVEFIFASSSDLSSELAVGNDADVFVSGDDQNMAAVATAGLTSATPVPIAANSLVIATAPGNQHKVLALADLTRPGLRTAVCGGPGACTTATRQLEDHFGVRLVPQNIETTDSDVVRDISSGKVDAGLVFNTTAQSAGDNISWFPFPEAADALVTSWIAPLKGSDQAELAAKFVQDVTSAAGRKVFADDGFAQPGKKFEG